LLGLSLGFELLNVHGTLFSSGFFLLGSISKTTDAYDLVMFFEQMHPTWRQWLATEQELLESIESKVLDSDIVPPANVVMRAFASDPHQVKVVLIGQDPYPTPGDAIGLAFAVSTETKTPRSLKNIVTELESDIGIGTVANPMAPELSRWADQGVLLLNRGLTTLPGVSGAHLGSAIGWEEFTLRAVKALVERQPVVLMLWGNSAKAIKSQLGDVTFVESAHPSPLSVRNGFFGSKVFSAANQKLSDLGLEPIDWSC
jgi:uracil-DNA glycosylase